MADKWYQSDWWTAPPTEQEFAAYEAYKSQMAGTSSPAATWGEWIEAKRRLDAKIAGQDSGVGLEDLRKWDKQGIVVENPSQSFADSWKSGAKRFFDPLELRKELSGGKDKAAAPPAYEPDPNAFKVESGVDPYWEEQARVIRESGAETLAPLRRLALGEDSIVAKQTQIEREQIARGLQSEVAGQRGGYDPALARQALMAGSQANVDLGARSAVGMAQEKVNAGQAYDQAMTTRNIGALQALGYGVQQRGQQASSLQDLERLRMTAGQQAFQNEQTILDRNQRSEAANMQFLGSALTTLARLWGGPAGGAAADAAMNAATQQQQPQQNAPPMGWSPAQQTAKPAGWWDPSRSQTSYLGGQSAPSSPTNPFGWQTAQKRSPLLDPYGR